MENTLTNWQNGKSEELKFWDTWLSSKGGHWKEHGYDWTEDFRTRVDPDSVLQDYIADIARQFNMEQPVILDLCAGPLTIVNKTFNGKRLNIFAYDALADEYNIMLDNCGIIPIVRTMKGDVEELIIDIKADIIHVSNGLDHSYDPLEGIKKMLLMLNRSGFIVLKHFIREGERGNYGGLHQWNFDVKDNRFIITDRNGKVTDVENEIKYFIPDAICKCINTVYEKELVSVIFTVSS